MRKPIDLTGQRFGRLTALNVVGSKNGHSTWLCQCDCGNTKVVTSQCLRQGKTKSCGCIGNNKQKTHGMTGTRLYKIWRGMIDRCCNTRDHNYTNYGSRGIKVCNEWKHFEPFRDWAFSNGYTEDLSIDRVDVNGDYCPENCRWADSFVQQNNKRNNHVIEYNGESHTLTGWSRMIGITSANLRQRLQHGWSIEKALTTPRLFTTKRKLNNAES